MICECIKTWNIDLGSARIYFYKGEQYNYEITQHDETNLPLYNVEIVIYTNRAKYDLPMNHLKFKSCFLDLQEKRNKTLEKLLK